jgi:Tfp pilus assembly protein PilO
MLLVLAIIGTIYLFYAYLYEPVTSQTRIISAENQNLNKEVESSQNRIKSAAGLSAEWERLQQQYTELAVKVPGESMLPEALSYLDKSAAECGVELETISLQPMPVVMTGAGSTNGVESSLQQVKIQLSLRGSYFNLLSYLLKIEKAPRLYRIENAQMSHTPALADTSAQAPEVAAGEQAATDPALPAATVVSEIALNISLTTFYDTFSLPDFKAELERVQPGVGKDNPFED